MLQVTNLSLDEPDLEEVVFTDDGSGNEANNCEAEDEDVMEVWEWSFKLLVFVLHERCNVISI